MDVLLIGGGGNVTDALIEKLHKEGDRISVLTGDETKKHGYKHVFEEYAFSYDSNSIKEIFESVDPDVTIYMGAFDTNFDWNNAREESVRYSAGLLNILMAYSLVKCGKFVYLSSHEVFSRSYPNNIPEEQELAAKEFKAMVIAQGEELCKNYMQFENLDILILRLDHLCTVPENKSQVRDFCAEMCVEALRTGKVRASDRNQFSLLFLSDALEFINQILRAHTHRHGLYHLSSGRVISEMDLAKMVQAEMGSGISIQDDSVGAEYRVVLSPVRFQKEFDGKIFYEPEQIVKKTAEYIRSHKNRFLENDDRSRGFFGRLTQSGKSVFRAMLPFLENMIVFVPIFMLNNRAVDSRFFAKLDFYLLYVLLFALVYGQQQATFSAILATAGYCFRQMYTRSGFEVVMDYNTYVWVAQLFILGLVVGYMRDRLNLIRKEGKDEVQYLSGQIGDIQDINTSNVRIKNVLEEQIVNHNQSVGKVYDITSELDRYTPEEVMFYSSEVVGRLLDSRDVAIYTVANASFARLYSSTSERARELGYSIRYDQMEDLYKVIREQKVYINKQLTPGYPLLASGIFEEDEMQMIIMIWGIPWERMNLGLANLLTVIGYLIQNAVLRANRYQKALESERLMEGTKILEKDAFRTMVLAYSKAQLKGLTECALLAIPVQEEQLKAMGEKVGSLLRSTDYLGVVDDDNLYVLLANTNQEGAKVVIRRLQDMGCQAQYQEDLYI